MLCHPAATTGVHHIQQVSLWLQAFLQQRRAELMSPSYEALASGLPAVYRDTTLERMSAMLKAVKVPAATATLLRLVKSAVAI